MTVWFLQSKYDEIKDGDFVNNLSFLWILEALCIEWRNLTSRFFLFTADRGHENTKQLIAPSVSRTHNCRVYTCALLRHDYTVKYGAETWTNSRSSP